MSIRKIRLAINSEFKLEVGSVQVRKYLTCFIISLSVFNNSCINRQKTNVADLPKPNIVFILTDDQAWNVLGRDGRYTFMKTPNIDRIAGEGMVFDNAFTTTSLCSPSRACFMTGCYAHKHGVYINSYSDPDTDAPYLPKALQEAGYETAFLGKWHISLALINVMIRD